MSRISVKNLTFSYDTNHENIFENVSFELDTDWKLGLIGRNGRGKTTFLRLLEGRYKFTGEITCSVSFGYFPYDIENPDENTLSVIRGIIAPYDYWESLMSGLSGNSDDLARLGEIMDAYAAHNGYSINALIEREISKLDVSPEILGRPFRTLSNGERTKLQIAALFLKKNIIKNNFLLIDEPTNHLDAFGRKKLAEYLSGEKSFILVSHDRMLLDNVIDHVMSINKSDIEVERGNYSSWKLNRDRQDQFELDENKKLKKDIKRLKIAFERGKEWSDKVEATKIGFGPTDRGRIGHLAAKAMKRAKNIEHRQLNQIDEKSKLLKNIEGAESLKLQYIPYFKQRLINAAELSISYGERQLFGPLSFTVNTGDKVAVTGRNGSGKTSLIKLILGENIPHSGKIEISSGLKISYVPQDTSFVKGSLRQFCDDNGIDETLFKAIMRKLDFTRVMFEKDMSEFSEGQKKKTLIAKSLSQEANLYIWDEPLNFVDVLSRVQIEELILSYAPTMIFVEHDMMFARNIAAAEIALS